MRTFAPPAATPARPAGRTRRSRRFITSAALCVAALVLLHSAPPARATATEALASTRTLATTLSPGPAVWPDNGHAGGMSAVQSMDVVTCDLLDCNYMW